jgi:triacylglycerol lipase
MKGGKLHLVAHSMGGLDARLGITRLGLADRVATLVTLGTPHRGTPLASIIPRLPALRKILRGLEDLSPSRVKALEDELADVADVRYASFLLAPSRGARGVCAPLLPSYLWLELQHGASDGLVPTSSQSRGHVMGTLDTDHWGAIGWGPTKFDAAGFYERLGVHLAADESLESF